MIEFTLDRNRNGKKSRWAKKYPRRLLMANHLLSLRSTEKSWMR